MSTATILTLARTQGSLSANPGRHLAVTGCRGLCLHTRVHVMRIARAQTRRRFFTLVFSPKLSLREKKRTLVPRSRASAHRAFQTRRRWRASATLRLRARRRLTDFCNTNRRTGTTTELPILTVPAEAKTPTAPHVLPLSLARENEPREKRASRSRATGMTPSTATLQWRRDAKAERLRAKAAGALDAGSPLLDSNSYTHCHDSPRARGRKPTRPTEPPKIRVCTVSREGHRTPTNQGAFHLR